MAKSKSQPQPQVEPPPWAPWLTQAAFVLTLILVVARVLMSESVREGFDVAHSMEAPTAPGPTTTLVLDALCCLPALLVLLRRAVDREYVIRWNWSHVLLFALAAWAGMSFAWATDKFAAAVAGANLITAAVLVWSTAQLVRSWVRLRIVAGVCLGLLLACWAHGLIYRFVDYPDNVRFWNQNKERIFAEQGWEPESFAAMQFEKKLLSGEVVGFNQSANSFAAVMVMLMVVSAGVAIQRAANGDGWAVPIFIALAACAPAMFTLYFTGSRTAAGTIFIATVTLGMLAISGFRAWLADNAAIAYAVVVLVTLFGAAALIGHGMTHGSLPQDSLNFRWRYWVAAARLVKQHPLAGVGWGNFGPHYTSVRLPAAAEEVKDPHNFIVRCFAELGIVGGLIALAWLARTAWELTRPIVPRATASTARPTVAGGLATIVAIALGGILLNMIAAIDWSQPPSFLLLEVFRRVLSLGVLLVGLVVATIRSRSDQQIDDRPAPWLLYAVLVAVGVFFVHNMMDFVLAEAGPKMIFAVLLGAAIGVRTPWVEGATKRRGVAIAVLSAAAIAWIIAVLAIVIPVADAEQLARDADALKKNRPDLAAAALRNAFRAVPYNADYAYRSAMAMMMGGAPPEQVKAQLDFAIATDRANASYHLTRAEYELSLPDPDAAAVRADYDKALALDPNNIQARVQYAKALADKLNDPRAAATQYRKALETSNGYDKTEPKRLSPEDVSKFEDLIKQLER